MTEKEIKNICFTIETIVNDNIEDTLDFYVPKYEKLKETQGKEEEAEYYETFCDILQRLEIVVSQFLRKEEAKKISEK